MIRSGCVHVCIVVLFKFRVAESHGGLKVTVLNVCRDSLSLFNSVYQWGAHDLVFANGNDGRRGVGLHVQHGTDSLYTLQGGQPAVIGAGRTTTLRMSQDGGPGVQVKALGEDVLDGVAGDFVQVTIVSALGDDDDGSALATLGPVLYGFHSQ